MVWITIDRPGHFGDKKEEINRLYSGKFGKDNWRVAWQWNKGVVEYITACQLYEDGYYADSFKREDLWRELASTARDVFDHQESDVLSGLDYLAQNGNATHLQDIAVRRVLLRRGISFEGNQLVQIRSKAGPLGQQLSPGKTPFHLPELIITPHLKKWWNYNSIEDFWQSNKVLQVRK